jgi:hypothetical protein
MSGSQQDGAPKAACVNTPSAQSGGEELFPYLLTTRLRGGTTAWEAKKVEILQNACVGVIAPIFTREIPAARIAASSDSRSFRPIDPS